MNEAFIRTQVLDIQLTLTKCTLILSIGIAVNSLTLWLINHELKKANRNTTRSESN